MVIAPQMWQARRNTGFVMKKVALVFALAVFVPSLVLAWLAVRSLRDQQFVLERQQSLLYQNVADSLAKEADAFLSERQHEFALQVESLLAGRSPVEVAPAFDERLRSSWQLADVGFVVTLSVTLMCPSPLSRPEAQVFCKDNNTFLANRESVEVYWNSKNLNTFGNNLPAQQLAQSPLNNPKEGNLFDKNAGNYKTVQNKLQQRAVVPQQQELIKGQSPNPPSAEDFVTASKVTPSETEFRQLIGDANEGTLARFVDNKLRVLFWHRSARERQLVFGAQLALPKLNEDLKSLLKDFESTLQNEICIAILDDKAKPVATTVPAFSGSWKRPFVATEIGDALPHWEAAVYLLDPSALNRSARTVRWTLGLFISVLVLAIAVGSWLIVADLNRQITLARQKTDFVSNVSHELKTPLTSIRMFSELLAEGRILDPAKQRSYLGIITAETARLTRLINNVLDFARIERGEKKYSFQVMDLNALARETAEAYRPQLEAGGFHFEIQAPDADLWLNGDRDAIAQILVNLLSNAEKYSNQQKEIILRVEKHDEPLPYAEVKVLDRGIGVPPDSHEKIFEQFYRAHDSLSSGIQGSGLGLTLARQIARAHCGDVLFESRDGGGSCFILRLPLKSTS